GGSTWQAGRPWQLPPGTARHPRVVEGFPLQLHSLLRRAPGLGRRVARAAARRTGVPVGLETTIARALRVECRPVARPPGIDVHAHFFPESFIRLIEEAGAPFGAGIDRSNPQGPVIMFGASRTAPLDPRFVDLDL